MLICANDPIAPGLIRHLQLADVPVYVIEPDTDVAMHMQDLGVPVFTGEIDSVETYRAAGAARARLVLANASDTVNSNIVLTVRELSDSVPVVALAEAEDSIDVLELSGATHVLPLIHQLGEHLANRVSAGTSHVNVIGKFHQLLLAEFPVHNTPFQGQTIRDTRLREFTGATIVGVWERGRFLPSRPDLELSPLSVPVVIGTPEQISELDEVLVIYDPNPNPVLIVGGGKVGRAAAVALKRRQIPVHMVERDPELEPQAGSIPDRFVLGDAADRRVLEEAGIAETPCILLTTHDDAMNIYLTVYCRRLNPNARILTRVTHERNVEAIQRAGADFVLSYASLGMQTVYSIVQGRELIVLGEGVDLFNAVVGGANDPGPHVNHVIDDLLRWSIDQPGPAHGVFKVFSLETPAAKTDVFNRLLSGLGEVDRQHQPPIVTVYFLVVLGGRLLGYGPNRVQVRLRIAWISGGSYG